VRGLVLFFNSFLRAKKKKKKKKSAGGGVLGPQGPPVSPKTKGIAGVRIRDDLISP